MLEEFNETAIQSVSPWRDSSRGVLTPVGITQTAFAEKLGWTRARLNELINGKRGVTADAALDLAEALGTTAKLWMNLQATYELDRARKRREQVA